MWDTYKRIEACVDLGPPFSPEAVVEEFATLIKSYRCAKVFGDRYAGEWPREQFQKRGVFYEPSEKSKSELYRDLLPIINSDAVGLLENDRLVVQRRTARGGKDSIDHAPGTRRSRQCGGGCIGVRVQASGREQFQTADSLSEKLDSGRTLNPEGDLTNHPRFIAMYEDGTEDCFAVPACSLGQGPMNILPIVAWEWQQDGYLKPGVIVGIRPGSLDRTNTNQMVPHLIHSFWHSEADLAIPHDVAFNLFAWRATHPLFHLKVWSLAEVRPILANTPGAEEAVDTCRFIAMQADIVRLALLVAYGGVWTDLKNLPVRTFLDGLLNESEATFAEHFPSKVKEFRKGHINNSFIVAPPQHSFLTACLQEAIGLVLRRQAGNLWNITGAGMIMRMMQCHEGWRILPCLEVWGPRDGPGGWMTRTRLSYMTSGQHWSEREKTESLYL